MNIHGLNRVLVILFSILTVIFWTGLVFAVWAYPRPLGGSLRQIGTVLASADPFFRVIVTLLGLAVVLVAFLILLSEFMPETGPVVRLPQVTGGQALISTDSLAQLVKHEAERVPHVVYARPQVTSLGNRIDVAVELSTDPLAHAPATVEEVCRAIRDTVEERTGVKIRNLTVQLRHDLPGLGNRGGRPVHAAEAAPEHAITVPASAASPAAPGLAAAELGERRTHREEENLP